MSSVQEALKAREERKKREQEEKKAAYEAKINSALDNYRQRKQSNSQSAISDIASRLNTEIESAKTLTNPSWDDSTLGSKLDSTRASRVNIENLKLELDSYKNYIDESTYDELSSVLGTLSEGYDSYLRSADSIVKYQSVKDSEDFEQYSQIGTTIENPDWDDTFAPLDIFGWTPFGDGDEINNMVTFAEANKHKVVAESATRRKKTSL